MNLLNDLLKYYSYSLADGDIQQISKDELNSCITFQHIEFTKESDKLSAYFKSIKLKEENSKSTPIAIAPFYLAKKINREDPLNDLKFFPFWIPALLTADGSILPPKEGEMPWFLRDSLEPYILSKSEIPCISSVKEVNDALNLTIFNYNNWDLYWNSCENLFLNLTNTKFHNYVHEEAVVCSDITIIHKEISKATISVSKLYKAIKNTPTKPELIVEVLQNQQRVQSEVNTDKSVFLEPGHYGQFNKSFPLSTSQRQTIHSFIKDQKETPSSVLAVNGPPGTGKTTLLQSIIANELINHILQNKNAPRIIATSANNQAITNILDSFQNINNIERWLPNLPTLGTYLTNNNANNYQTIRNDKQGFNGFYFTEFENNTDNFNHLKSYFLSKYNSYQTNSTCITIENAVSNLKKEVLENCKKIDLILSSFHDRLTFETNFFPLNTIQEKKNILEEKEKNLLALRNNLNNIKKYQREDFDLFFNANSQSILEKVFKKQNAKRDKKIQLYLASSPIEAINSCKSYDEASSKLLDILKQKTQDLTNEEIVIKNLRAEISNATTILNNYIINNEYLESIWANYLLDFSDSEKATKERLFENISVYEQINIILDLTLRYKSFVLSIHYWEGQWLLKKQESDCKQNKGLQAINEFYERSSCLTPLFVSTLHSLPNFCNYFQFVDEKWEQEYIYNLFDLLLVDEAGQVTPEMGIPAFSFSKRALIVGDTKQIEPIWKINYTRIDKANLTEAGVLNHFDFETLVDKNILCSSGSLMHLAQNASRFKTDFNLGGTMLTEHRRCNNNLVAFCNEYVYNGKLQPLKGNLDFNSFNYNGYTFDIPPFAYLNISGHSNKKNGSLKNSIEADAIAKWIKTYEKHIINFYNKNGNSKTIDELIAVVTPFKGQLNEIKNSFKKFKISNKIIVGTVHSLQGAEIPIVLFSPTYGVNHTSNDYFFDRGFNMLNVAITRAKDHFIVIGNMRVFNNNNGHLPSNGLAKYLFNNPENELPSAFLFDTLDPNSEFRVATLKKHQQCIKEVFEKAISKVIIVSPFISINAIKADGIIEKIVSFKQKGQNKKVIVYTDSDLDKTNGTLKSHSALGREALINAGVELKILKGIHNKALIKDNDTLIEGSFNWLSATRDIDNKYYRHEVSQILSKSESKIQIPQLLLELDLIKEIK